MLDYLKCSGQNQIYQLKCVLIREFVFKLEYKSFFVMYLIFNTFSYGFYCQVQIEYKKILDFWTRYCVCTCSRFLQLKVFYFIF